MAGFYDDPAACNHLVYPNWKEAIGSGPQEEDLAGRAGEVLGLPATRRDAAIRHPSSGQSVLRVSIG